MRKAVLLALIVIPLALLARLLAAPPDRAEEEAMKRIRPESLRAHIRFLADNSLEGRGTGTRGHELAAKYVAAQFEAMGLAPGGANGSYFQPVPLRKVELVQEQSSLTILQNGKEQAFSYGEDFLMRGDPLRTENTLESPVVLAGYGVTAPELNYDDYAGTDVRGKIVVYLSGAPAKFPPTLRAYFSSGPVKAAAAASHGAIGMLQMLTLEDEKRQPWQFRVNQFRFPAIRWLDANGVPNDARPEIRGQATLSRSGAEALFAGAPKSLDDVLASASAGQASAFPLSATAKLRTVSRHTPLESPNVLGMLHGSDPKLRDEYVVYTAHADHLGIGRPVDGDAIYNGMLDNASGTAALLEVARAFASLSRPPKRSVLFVVVTGEEAGLLGSDFFAHSPTVPLERIVANVNIDGIPGLYPLRDVVPFGAEHSSLGEVVRQSANRLELEVSPDPMPEEVFFIRSDQYSFVRQGVPAVFLTEGFKTGDPKLDGGALTRQWLQTRYHTPKDDVTQPFDYNPGAKFAQLNFLIGYQIAQQSQRPTWNKGDFFGEKFGRNRKP